MSKRNSNPTKDAVVQSEADLQEKWRDHPSEFVQGVLQHRRESVKQGRRFLTMDEINREVARRRRGDAAA